MKNIFVLMLLGSTAFAAGDTPSPWITQGNLGITMAHPLYLTISCGHGTVSINTDDGSVKFDGGCVPDDAAKSFWIAIRAMYGIGCPNADKK